MAYVWPKTLRLPIRPPKVVFLDLLHWIALAKANTAHPDGERYRETLDGCVEAVDRGVAVFPISDSIYMEVSKISQRRQRRDLRDVIERVCRYLVVTSRVTIAQHEVEAFLDEIVGPSSTPINTMDYLDWGVARAFGKVGGFRVIEIDSEVDRTDEIRSQHPDGPEAFDRKLAQAELELNRRTLEGPTAEEEPSLREGGWDPRAGYQVAIQRAVQEMEQVARFNDDPTWRGARLRDVVAAREIIIELNGILHDGLAARGASLDDVMSDPDAARRAFDSMPSFDVAVTLKTAYHRNPAHRWKPNHIQDIDALASTVPYCDVVVADKEAASHLQQTGVAARFGTNVLSRSEDLLRYL